MTHAFLLDIDGTTLLGRQALPGAHELIALLRREGYPFLWLTNNTSRSRAGWLERLTDAGLEPQAHELYTAGDATIDFLSALAATPRTWLVGPPDLAADFEEAGIAIARATDDAEAVVLAYDTGLTYERIAATAHLLLRGLPYYATHPDTTCPTPDGPVPDVGSFMALFETATGRRPQVIGKPESTMVEGALDRLGVDAASVTMVGDRLTTDIRMARQAGLRSWLVLTGVTTADAKPDGQGADRTSPSLVELHAWLKEGGAE